MKTEKHINALWAQMRDALEQSSNEIIADFMRWDGLELRKLLAEETQNERRHRAGNLGDPYPLSSGIGARITIMHNVAAGAKAQREPLGREFIALRHSAALAHVIGYHLRADLTREWLEAASLLDYARLMKNP